jgi:alpha-galactosidase
MLEVGNRGMTETEYRSQFSLWAIMAAPLIAGDDLRTMNAITKGILTNPEIILVDQDPAGIQGKVVSQDGTGLQVWSKPLADGTFAVALFNRSANTASIHASWQSVGVTTTLGEVRDLWQRKDLGVFHTGFSAEVPPHDTVVIKVTGRRG